MTRSARTNNHEGVEPAMPWTENLGERRITLSIELCGLILKATSTIRTRHNCENRTQLKR